MEILRKVCKSLQQVLKSLGGDAGLGTVVWFLAAEIRLPETGWRWLLRRAGKGFGFVELPLEIGSLGLGNLLAFLVSNFAECDQMLEITVANGWPVLDRLVDEWLSEAWLVGFVVTP